VFGFTEQQIATFGLTFGITGFMLYMLFIVYKLSRESKAGTKGTLVLFFVLGFGMLGFAAKSVIQHLLEI
jgi:hypothetical protein